MIVDIPPGEHRIEVRLGPTAVRLAETANKLTDDSQPVLMNTLAEAYAEAGHFDKAVAAGQRARQLAVNSGRTALVPQIQNCLELYQAGKPYREQPPANVGAKSKNEN